MLHCFKCSSVIEENQQYYIVEDMGPEIVTILENQGQLVSIYTHSIFYFAITDPNNVALKITICFSYMNMEQYVHSVLPT